MKLVCSRDALAEALAIAGSVVISRTPAPVLLCLKLEAKDGLLFISATDTEIGLLLGVAEVDVREEGVALIPADKLNQIVRASNDDSLSIEVSKNIATITGRDSKFKVFGFDPEEFPGVPTFDANDFEFETNGKTFRRLIGRTVFATAVENKLMVEARAPRRSREQSPEYKDRRKPCDSSKPFMHSWPSG